MFINRDKIVSQGICKAFGIDIQKGEGDRGGHVIGHTKTGHPIYEGNRESGKTPSEFTWKKTKEGHLLHHHGESTGLGVKHESDKYKLEQDYKKGSSYSSSNNLKKKDKEGSIDLGIDGVNFNYKISNDGFYDVIEQKTGHKIPFMSPASNLKEAKENAYEYIKDKLGIDKFKDLVNNYKG